MTSTSETCSTPPSDVLPSGPRDNPQYGDIRADNLRPNHDYLSVLFVRDEAIGHGRGERRVYVKCFRLMSEPCWFNMSLMSWAADCSAPGYTWTRPWTPAEPAEEPTP